MDELGQTFVARLVMRLKSLYFFSVISSFNNVQTSHCRLVPSVPSQGEPPPQALCFLHFDREQSSPHRKLG